MDVKNEISKLYIKYREWLLWVGLVLFLFLITIAVFKIRENIILHERLKEEKQKYEQLKETSDQLKIDLADSVREHDSIVQFYVYTIDSLTRNRKPFKPLKYDTKIKVKSASYDYMRRVLDTARPNI